MSSAAPTVVPFRRRGAEACEYIGPEGWYWSKGNRIYRSDEHSSELRLIGTVPSTGLRRALGRTRAGRRLARQNVYNVQPIPGSHRVFFSFDREVGVIEGDGVRLIVGRPRKTRLLRNGMAALPDGTVLFGEYLDNPERGPVDIFALRPGADSVKQAYRFPAGSIRHIHSVNWDPYTHRVLVATGDVAQECRLMSFTSGFQDESTLGCGDEDWRIISPQFAADAIYFGTDAQFRTNTIRRYDRQSGTVVALAETNGPVFYSAQYKDGWLFATAAELCASQTSPEAILYYLDPQDESVTPLAAFAKDRWSTRLFQFGLLSIPIFASTPEVLPLSGTALRGLDGRFVALA